MTDYSVCLSAVATSVSLIETLVRLDHRGADGAKAGRQSSGGLAES
jgi:hypothetical protein